MKKYFIWPVCLFILFLCTVALLLYYRINETMTVIYEPLVVFNDETPARPRFEKNIEPIAILFLGIDKNNDGSAGGRADTIMLATINPLDHLTTLLSIPRDTLVYIPDLGYEDKINHAYAFGGVSFMANTISYLLQIPIHYYISINMDGFKDFVDAIGGVTIDNVFLEFQFDGIYFPLGKQKLDGKGALAFARMRYDDPLGEYGRQARQRLLIQQMLDHFLTPNVKRFSHILAAVESNLTTNITLDEALAILQHYRIALHHIEELTLEADPQWLETGFYLIILDSVLMDLRQLLQERLSLP